MNTLVALHLFLTTGNIRSAAHSDFNLSKVTEGAALNPSSTMGNVNPRWLVGCACCSPDASMLAGTGNDWNVVPGMVPGMVLSPEAAARPPHMSSRKHGRGVVVVSVTYFHSAGPEILEEHPAAFWRQSVHMCRCCLLTSCCFLLLPAGLRNPGRAPRRFLAQAFKSVLLSAHYTGTRDSGGAPRHLPAPGRPPVLLSFAHLCCCLAPPCRHPRFWRSTPPHASPTSTRTASPCGRQVGRSKRCSRRQALGAVHVPSSELLANSRLCTAGAWLQVACVACLHSQLRLHTLPPIGCS